MKEGFVTIFGGSGFIGRYLVERLVNKGWRIKIPIRSSSRDQHLKVFGDVGQVACVSCNFNNKDEIKECVKNADVVINLVGILTAKKSINFENIHVGIAKNISLACKETLVNKIIHVSAIGANTKSPSVYLSSKGRGEIAVISNFDKSIILRPSVVFGDEDQFLNRFASIAKVSPIIPLIGNGKNLFQPIWVGDVADAIVKSIDILDSAPRIYELGGPRIWEFKEVLVWLLNTIKLKRKIVSIPSNVSKILSYLMMAFPTPPFTPDHVLLLRENNIVTGNIPGLEKFDIMPSPMELKGAAQLSRFMYRGGHLNS